MADMAAVAKATASKSITTKHLAYELAEQHQLTKHQGLAMMEDLIGMITTHLKKGERVKLVGLGILQVRNRAARAGRIRRLARQSRLRPAKRSPSAPPRNSRRRSDRQGICGLSEYRPLSLNCCIAAICPSSLHRKLRAKSFTHDSKIWRSAWPS